MTKPNAPPKQETPPVKEEALKKVDPGDPEVFVKIGSDGKLVATKTKVRLREDLGHIYEVKGKCQISSLGYHALNAWAGISLVGPRQILMPEGKTVPNPHLERDDRTGYIKAVWVRRVAFGLSPTATLTVVDRTLYYDLRTQLLETLVKEVNKNPKLGAFLPDNRVNAHEESTGKKGWFVIIEPPVGVWLDLGQKEVIEMLETHTQRLRFAERIATSICERNALRSHPSISKTQIVTVGEKPRRTSDVWVIGFRHELDKTRLEQLAVSIASDEVDQVKAQAEAMTGASVERDVKEEMAVSEEAEQEEATAVNGEIVEVSSEAPPQQEAPAVDIGKEVTHRQKLLAEIKQGRAALGDEPAFFKLMEKLSIKTTLAETADDLLSKLNRAVSEEVDRRAEKK